MGRLVSNFANLFDTIIKQNIINKNLIHTDLNVKNKCKFVKYGYFINNVL